MTTIIVYDESGRHAPLDATDDARQIHARLAAFGIGFERQDASLPIPSDADTDFVLRVYAEAIDRLRRRRGYSAVDVFRLMPNAPDGAESRRKFLAEHTHADDEVRFIVEGGGTFYMRTAGRVVELRVERGDLISIPAGARHWFDCGDPPYCTSIRLFTRPDGWVGAFTGDQIVARFAAPPA
jgi:1,2-dihydroxy-3-keto-5-methylthiopentene dioxygenase